MDYKSIPENFEKESTNYYESIKKRFRETIFLKNVTSWGRILSFSVFIPIAFYVAKLMTRTDVSSISAVAIILGASIICTFLYVKIKIYSFWKWILNIKPLTQEEVNFCYIFLAHENLKYYLSSGYPKYLSKAGKYLEHYMNELIYFLPSQRASWLKFTDDSEEIIKCLSYLHRKIYSRISKGYEIAELHKALSFLKVYALSKKKDKTNLFGDEKPNNIVGDLYLLAFARQVNDLEMIAYNVSPNLEKTPYLKKIGKKLNSLLYAEHVIINLIVWFCLLSGFLSLIKYLGLFKTETYDSLILKYAFLGAIALAVGIFKKKQS